jgi:hypothetical protein
VVRAEKTVKVMQNSLKKEQRRVKELKSAYLKEIE